MNDLIDLRDELHERRIAVLAARIIEAMAAKEMATARAIWPQFKSACLSRSPAQVALMEQKLFRRAA